LSLRCPREANLEIVTDDGRIEIEESKDRCAPESGEPYSRPADVGRIRLRTEDGSIVGRELDASVRPRPTTATSSSKDLRPPRSDNGRRRHASCVPIGGIDARGWVVRTADGAIRVLLLRPRREIDATASDGRISNRLSSFDGAGRGRR
jgi:hypothetical protein